MEKQRKTFLSYSRANKDFAIRLAKELKSEGFEIWLDQLDIPLGARWDDEVERALEECEIFMVILTPASTTSDNVKDEIGYAIDTRKRILPILLENAVIPLRLRRLQYVDFTSNSFDEGVNAAKELLKGLVAQPTVPRTQYSQDPEYQNGQSEGEIVAAEKAEQGRSAKQKAEGEQPARAKADEHHEEFIATALAPAKRMDAPVAVPIPPKKAGSWGILFVLVGMVALAIAVMVIRASIGGNETPAATDEPVHSDPASEPVAATEELMAVEPATEAPTIVGQWEIVDADMTQHLVFGSDGSYQVEARSNSTNEVLFSGAGTYTFDSNHIYYYDLSHNPGPTESYSLDHGGALLLITNQDSTNTQAWTRIQ